MRAIATLLYNEAYLPGALVLGHTLRKIVPANTKLVVLIDESAFSEFQLDLLRGLWDELIDTQIFESELQEKLLNDLKRPELAATFTKIQLWALPYEKVLYLDADTLPVAAENNVTSLLEVDAPKGSILAAPDAGFPDIFNSGVFVLQPNDSDYQNLVDLVSSGDSSISFDGADQGLLNQYFNPDPDWVTQLLNPNKEGTVPSKWVKIPFLYNTTPNAQYEYIPAAKHLGFHDLADQAAAHESLQKNLGDGSQTEELYSAYGKYSPYYNTALTHFTHSSQLKVLHFIGPVKPWNSSQEGIFDLWWNQWYEYSHGKPIDSVLEKRKAIAYSAASSTGLKVTEKLSPADLCDPLRYQHLVDEHTHTSSFWDATKESPPRMMPQMAAPVEAHRFKNAWEDTADKSPQAEVAADSIEQVNSDERGAASEYGIYKNHTAERVFDTGSNYVPRHRLIEERDQKKAESEVEEAGSLLNDIKLENSRDKEILAVEKHGAKIDFVDDSDAETPPPKIFPWEYRENYTPERVWD